MKTAIVIGATGLVGRQLVMQLLEDNAFGKVKVFVRRSFGVTHEKLEEHLTNFGELSLVARHITGDILFSCLGTTLKQAGSQAAQYIIDYNYQYDFAKIASSNSVPHYVLVSSVSANPNSMFFYTKMKGKLEESIKVLPFQRISIVRPSALVGLRDAKRKGEETGGKVINFLGKIIPPMKKYRSITGLEVAKAMQRIAKLDVNNKIGLYQLDELHALADAYNKS